MLKLVAKMASLNNSSISSIEGNIACGKSTILNYISSKNNLCNVYCIQEPIAEWTHMKNGTDLLRLFYQENERWSFTFENTVQLSRLKTFYESKKYLDDHNKENKYKIFTERSIFSSFNVFGNNSFEESRLTKVEFDILNEYYKFFVKQSYSNINNINSIINNGISNENNSENEYGEYVNGVRNKIPFKIIYIRTDPHVCFERLKKRNRSSEIGISLDYLNKIHFQYEKWIESVRENDESNVKIINGNSSKDVVLAQISELINE